MIYYNDKTYYSKAEVIHILNESINIMTSKVKIHTYQAYIRHIQISKNKKYVISNDSDLIKEVMKSYKQEIECVYKKVFEN